MPLTKELIEDKIEIVTVYKHIQVRTATVIKEDGSELSRGLHRKTINCGFLDADRNLVNTDISGESPEVQGICNAVWNDSIREAWRQKLIRDQYRIPGTNVAQ